MNKSYLPENLVELCLRGDEPAWTTLRAWLTATVNRLGLPVFSLHSGEREDIIQQTLHELLRNDCRALRAFAGRSRLETYLVVILRRVIRDFREQRSHADTSLDSDMPLPAQTDQIDWQRDAFWEAVAKLPDPDDRFILRFFAEGFPIAEIATVLQRARGQPWTETKVAVRKHRALERVRRSLRGE